MTATARFLTLAALVVATCPAQAVNLPFSSVAATYDQISPGFFPAARMIDGVTNDNSGWAIFRNTGAADDTHSESAVFTLASPLAAGSQTLTFTIFQLYSDPFHVLGNFSLAYTTAAAPALASPQTLLTILSATSTVAGTVLTSPSTGRIDVTGTVQATDTYTILVTLNSALPVRGFFLNAIDTNGDAVAGGGPGRQPSNGNFVVSEFTVASTVPEPSSWALWLTGFALTGVAARRLRGHSRGHSHGHPRAR